MSAHPHGGCIGAGCPICVRLALPGYEEVRRRLTSPAPAVVPPRRQWPLLARVIAKFRRPEDRGIGDTIARRVGPLGGEAFKRVYKRLFGCDCGCGDRQQKLNAAFPYLPEGGP